MSCEAVKTFLEQENQKEKNKEAQYRYEVLSHFKLGKEIVYNGDGNIDDYPLLREDVWGKTIRFKYTCDISDEDFNKIQTIYETERLNNTIADDTPKSNKIKDGAEKTLNVCAVIFLILGILSVLCGLVATIDDIEMVALLGIGIGVFLLFLFNCAFAKVIVNISRKLNK